MLSKSNQNFLIDGLMFLVMAALGGIGFLLKYALLSGSEAQLVYGDKVDLYFWGIDRHAWGTIHLVLGFVLLALLALHIILHWRQIVCMYPRLIRMPLARQIVLVLVVIICLILVIAPFFVNPEVVQRQTGGGGGGHSTAIEMPVYPAFL